MKEIDLINIHNDELKLKISILEEVVLLVIKLELVDIVPSYNSLIFLLILKGKYLIWKGIRYENSSKFDNNSF